jgi:hypothetical protein
LKKENDKEFYVKQKKETEKQIKNEQYQKEIKQQSNINEMHRSLNMQIFEKRKKQLEEKIYSKNHANKSLNMCGGNRYDLSECNDCHRSLPKRYLKYPNVNGISNSNTITSKLR